MMDNLKSGQENSRKQLGFIAFNHRKYPVYEGLNIIGRDPKATIRVKDLTFSKQHAVISIVNETTHLISDFGSSNGTEIEGKKLVPLKFYELKDLEAISFGDIIGMYHTGTNSYFDTGSEANATQSQAYDASANTQILTQNLHDLPTQDIVCNTNKRIIHEAETQPIVTTKDCGTNIICGETENFSMIGMNDDLFANETFRASLQSSRYSEVVDETLPTKISNSMVDDDDIILSTQDNAKIDQQTLEFCKNSESQQKSTKKDDDDSATDIEDEEELKKKIHEKLTQLNESDSDTDVDEELLKQKVQEPLNDVSDTEENEITSDYANIETRKDDTTDEEEELDLLDTPNQKIDDENDDALLLVPTQLLENKKQAVEEDVELLAPTQLLQSTESKVEKQTFDKRMQEINDDDDAEAPTQLIINKNIEQEKPSKVSILSPTQIEKQNTLKKSILSTKHKDIDNDDDLPPTQILQEQPANDSIFSAPTQTLEQNKKINANIKRKDINNDDDDDLPPTQLLQSKNDSIFSAPTQILDQNNESAVSIKRNNINNDDCEDLPPTQLLQSKDDSIFSAPTQILDQSNKSIASTKNEINDDDLAPTQLLQPRNDPNSSAPIQILEQNRKKSILSTDPFSPPKRPLILQKTPKNKGKKSVNFSEDIHNVEEKDKQNIFNAPTQLLNEKNDIFDGETQIAGDKNIHDAPTQLLEANTQESSGNDSLNLFLSETEDESDSKIILKQKNTEPETQMEVDFALETQKLYVESKTSRPDNPIGHMFDEEPTQLTEDITDKKKKHDIESSRKLLVKLHDVNEVSRSETKNVINDESDFKAVNKRGRSKKQSNNDKIPIVTKKNTTEKEIAPDVETKEKEIDLKHNKKENKTETDLKQVKSKVESSKTESKIKKKQETPEAKKDKSHNTRGARISYQLLNEGKIENKKTKKDVQKKTDSEDKKTTPRKVEDTTKKAVQKKAEHTDKKEPLDVKKTTKTYERRLTKEKHTPKKEIIKQTANDNSSDFDDFVNRVTRSKRAHSVAETPKKKIKRIEIEDSEESDDSLTPTKKKVSKLEYTQEDSEVSNHSAVVKRKMKRGVRIEDYSSDENTNKTPSICLNTPNSKRRKYEPLNVTLNNSGDTTKHKIVFTMINDTTSFENSIKKLGGSIIDNIESCTVLITNKISRSLKFLEAVALAKPIVSPKWIQDCAKKNCYLDPWNYLLEDTDSEMKLDVSLKESLKRSAEKKLLNGVTVLIAAQKNHDVLKELVQASGGRIIHRAPGKNVKAIVVSYEEEKSKYSKYLKQKNLIVVAAEAIFSGVLRQELNWDKHLLS